MIYDAVCTYANKDLVIHFGCDRNEEINFSYSEVSVMIALLPASLAVDFVVTGCSSGQGTDQQGIIQKEYILSHGKRGENSILDESLCRQGIKALIRGHMLNILFFIISLIPSIGIYLLFRNRRNASEEYRKYCTKALVNGILCVFPVMLASFIFSLLGKLLPLGENTSVLYSAFRKFMVLAFAEESAKYYVFRRTLKKCPYPYSRLDVIVFMTLIGTGFGLAEDIPYAIGSSAGQMLVRGIIAGHAGYGFVMGYFSAKAIFEKKPVFHGIGFLISFLLHGIYNFTLDENVLGLNELIAIIPVLCALISILLLIGMIIFFIRAGKKKKYSEILA